MNYMLDAMGEKDWFNRYRFMARAALYHSWGSLKEGSSTGKDMAGRADTEANSKFRWCTNGGCARDGSEAPQVSDLHQGLVCCDLSLQSKAPSVPDHEYREEFSAPHDTPAGNRCTNERTPTNSRGLVFFLKKLPQGCCELLVGDCALHLDIVEALVHS